jgi:aspartate/methionine/tyrosine aminotransferase
MKLPPFALERFFARHEFSAKHLLCCSDCETLSVAGLLDLEPGARESLLGLRLGYTESPGSPSLRRRVAGLYAGQRPECILVFAGAEEAIYLFMQAALEPGDHAVVHCPCYQSLTAVAEARGCEVTRWETREEEGWALDAAALRGLLKPNTKAVVVNSPHNPTGYHMPEKTLREIVEITEGRGITLFSDEVYRGLEQDPRDMLPAACDLGEKTVSLGVMSKTYGLAGLRIGWLAARDRALLSRVASLKDYTTICSSAPSELLAEVALRHAEELAARNRKIIASNLDMLDAFFARHGELFTWRRPSAGPIAFPRLNKGDIATFCEDLVRKSGVLLLPGTVYQDRGNHFRVGFGRANMPEALKALEGYLTEPA